MKTFLKVLASVFVFMVVIIIALNLYFTNERLKNTVMPYVNEAAGRPVEVESMSLSFFSTFPQPGLSVNNLYIPGETEGDTLMALDQLVIGVKLSSLFGNEINISEIKLDHPRFIYTIRRDSSSNVDFLLSDDAEADTSEMSAINIPYFEITNGQFGYRDLTSETNILMHDFNANITLHYADQIKSMVDVQLGGLDAVVNDTLYVKDLPLSLTEESVINLENETVELQQGTFSIRGLELDLEGSISDWSSTSTVDLSFTSTSDNFGELLRLVPEEYSEYTEGLETRGSLSIDGSVKGTVGGEELPDFNAVISVTDGYLKNPDLSQPIENIQFSAKASNAVLVVEQLSAQAGSNNILASGNIKHPLREEGTFAFNVKGNVDLSTVRDFYDLNAIDIESLDGLLDLQVQAKGTRQSPDEAAFNASVRLEGGMLKYSKVPRAIENININADANQDVAVIRTMSLEAASNTFSAKGTVSNPLLSESRTVDLNTNLRFDLATVKDFYPIDEDTLSMNGLLTAQASLKGPVDRIERSIEKGSVTLKNGMIDYEPIEKSFQNITLKSELDGNRLTVAIASFETGENKLTASGYITDYLSNDRIVNLKLQGHARMSEIAEYYELQPSIRHLTGAADLNLAVEGQPDKPAALAFNGELTVNDINIDGESLVQPVRNLNGKLTLSPSSATLNSLAFRIGSSDVELNGSLGNYMEYLKARNQRQTTPHLKGSYHSEYLNLDELINWEDTTTTPTPIHLPHLTSSITASINGLQVTGVNMQNLEAEAETTPGQIRLNQASIAMFGGKANGSFVWKVPQPDHTIITFKGSLDSLRAEDFFKEYTILGEKSRFHEHVSGAFSSDVNYYSELDVYLSPVLETTEMDGSFGMTKARLKGHPIQQKVADFLNTQELRNAALDEWESTFVVDDNILTFQNLKLTSGNIGLEMSGTQHLVREIIDYNLNLHLPGRFKKAIGSVITTQAASALTQQNGALAVPLQVTGTLSSPKISPDQSVIKPAVQNFLKNKAGDALQKLFGGDGNN